MKDAKQTEDAGAEEPKAEAGGEGKEESSSRTPSPPIVVAITGPPKVSALKCYDRARAPVLLMAAGLQVGKSTLLRLVKNYVQQGVSQLYGPITIVVALTGPPKVWSSARKCRLRGQVLSLGIWFKVGKSTLLRSLVKNYVQQSVSQLNGSIPIVTGKRKRITFVEVPNQLTEMIDAAKVADYVS